MNPELTDKLLTLLVGSLSDGRDFVIAEAPLVVREYVQWAAIEGVVVGALLLLASVAIMVTWWVMMRDCDKTDRIGSLVPVALIVAIGLGGSGSFFLQAAKAYYTPRAYLLGKAVPRLR